MSWKFWQRDPRPSDGSVQLPTTATTNQFIENAAEKATEKVVGKYWWGVVELNKQLQERIQELEAEIERQRYVMEGKDEHIRVDREALAALQSDAERLRKAIDLARCEIKFDIDPESALATLEAALSPSPAAASGETKLSDLKGSCPDLTGGKSVSEYLGELRGTFAPAASGEKQAENVVGAGGAGSRDSLPNVDKTASAPAAESEAPEEDIIHWNTDWRNAVPGGGNHGVADRQNPKPGGGQGFNG